MLRAGGQRAAFVFPCFPATPFYTDTVDVGKASGRANYIRGLSKELMIGVAQN